MRFGLRDDIIEKISEIFRANPAVEEVIIYGSRANGNFKASSDIDLTMKGNLSLEEMNKISWQLDDLMLPYTVDLSIFEHIRQADLLDHIRRVGITFYKKD